MQVHQQRMKSPEKSYAMSKYSMEQLEHNNSVGLRFTTVYGLNARKEMLILKY